MTATLSVQNMHVQRGATHAVRDVSFVFVGPGWLGVVGANGSGKSSLLRAVAGRLPATTGTILLKGVDVSLDRLARARGMGFAPEPLDLPNDLSPRELFAITSRQSDYTVPSPDLSDLWQALALKSFLDRKIGTFSSGMRQRVAIYAAFIDHVDGIVVLDEPFNWLDPLSAYDVKIALKKLTARGLTLVTALHDMSSLALYCDHGLLMSGGQITLTLDQAELAAGSLDIGRFEAGIVNHLRKNPAVLG
jgi:ABC-2 type transport system ATP-binding protein